MKKNCLVIICLLICPLVFAQKEPGTLEEKQSLNREILFDSIQESIDEAEENISEYFGKKFLDADPYNIVSYEMMWGCFYENAGFYETRDGYFLAALRNYRGFAFVDVGDSMAEVVELFGQPDKNPDRTRKNTYYNNAFDLYITFLLDDFEKVYCIEFGKTGW